MRPPTPPRGDGRRRRPAPEATADRRRRQPGAATSAPRRASGATLRLTIEYEGTRYHGWQVQQNARSIAGELLRALADAGHDVLELGGSGRTDAGVHALAQVAHLRLRGLRLDAAAAEELRRTVNDRLPPDIHVLAAVPASPRFHARHDALSRSYLYQIALRRTAFAKRLVWWVKRPLDLDAVRAAAALLAGRHDFRHFCERPAEQSSTLVEVERLQVERHEALLLVRMVASHFLWKMVRRVVGTLVRVGAGELEPAAVARLLAEERAEVQTAEWTAPPSGLFLERVLYRGDPPLPPPSPVTPLSSDASSRPP
jgi:tRNA pseudouridine38-40 synthase